jgi:Skp family chaperone for outer membrane proteins
MFEEENNQFNESLQELQKSFKKIASRVLQDFVNKKLYSIVHKEQSPIYIVSYLNPSIDNHYSRCLELVSNPNISPKCTQP